MRETARRVAPVEGGLAAFLLGASLYGAFFGCLAVGILAPLTRLGLAAARREDGSAALLVNTVAIFVLVPMAPYYLLTDLEPGLRIMIGSLGALFAWIGLLGRRSGAAK